MKLKIKSLKVYLDCIYAVLREDLIEPKFVANVKLICQSALLGSLHHGEAIEKQIPTVIRTNWVYLLMWISKDVCERQEDIRQMASAVKAVECKVFDIFDQLTCYRLNAQLQRFLAHFRRFQET